MITSRDIANKKFERASFGGYRNEDVDHFLNEVSAAIEQLESQNSDLTKKLELLAEKLEEYRNDEESLRSALLSAQKLGDSVIRESKTKSEIILRDANIKAERLVNTAHDQVEKEKMVYIRMQKDVAAFKNKLLAIYKQHLEIISSLPEDVAKEKNREAAENAAAEERHAQQEPQQPEPAREPSRPFAKQPEEQRGADQDEYTAPSSEREAEPSYEEEDFEEPVQKPRKFIPIPQREAAPPEPKKSPYAEEYYEDFDEEEDQQSSSSQKRSKFGTLKFGAGYDLKRD